jgi:hypothetical protein
MEAVAHARTHGSSGVASRTRAAKRGATHDGAEAPMEVEGAAAAPIGVEDAAAAPMEVEHEGDGRHRAGLTRAGLIRAGLTTR